MSKITASVLFKLFINGYKRCHINDQFLTKTTYIQGDQKNITTQKFR